MIYSLVVFSPTQVKAAGEIINTLDFFVHEKAIASVGGEPVSQFYSSGEVLTVKFKQADVYELYKYDSSYIYLSYDSSWGTDGGQYSSYQFKGNGGKGGKWMKTSMRVGETIEENLSVGEFVRFTSGCEPTADTPFSYKNTLEAHYKDYEIGGTYGKDEVIVLKYGYGGGSPGFEKFYFSKKWGWIKWEGYPSGGATPSRVVEFNSKDATGLTLPKKKCVAFSGDYSASAVGEGGACVIGNPCSCIGGNYTACSGCNGGLCKGRLDLPDGGETTKDGQGTDRKDELVRAGINPPVMNHCDNGAPCCQTCGNGPAVQSAVSGTVRKASTTTSVIPFSLLKSANASSLYGNVLSGVELELYKKSGEVVPGSKRVSSADGTFAKIAYDAGQEYVLKISCPSGTSSCAGILAYDYVVPLDETSKPQERMLDITLCDQPEPKCKVSVKDPIVNPDSENPPDAPPTEVPNYTIIESAFGLSLNTKSLPWGTYLNFLLTWLYSIAGLVAVLYLILTGARLVSSGGNPVEIKKAKKKIQAIIFALLLILSAWIIAAFVGGIVLLQWTV
ncbi:MAG: hypothetical protein WCP97_03525 [bacterium]